MPSMTEPTPLHAKPALPRPRLMEISHTRWNYVLSFVADATVTLVLFVWSGPALKDPGAAAVVVLSALLTYSLYEYLMHRFVFHGRRAPFVFREGHAGHHRAPQAPLALPFFTSIVLAPVLLAPAIALLGPARGALFTGVCGLGYLTYGSLHHLLHTPAVRFAPLLWLRAEHEAHHARPGCNFGVTTPVWDFVFRTWSSPRTTHVPSRREG